MRCRSALTRVDALRTRELPLEERGEVEAHLKSCKSCDDSLHDVDRLASAVKAALTVTPPRSCKETLCRDHFDKVGEVWVAFTNDGIRMISARSEEDLHARYAKRFGRDLQRAAIPEPLKHDVLAALSGEGVRKPHVDLAEATELETAVREALESIPVGEVRTYSWVAQQVGRPKAIRAVASYCAKNIVPFVVPCHRVVPSGGGVGEYAYGSRMKRELLAREGVDVDALESLAREGVRYIGSKTTKIYCFPTCKDARRIREENRVPFHGSGEAEQKGFRPCQRCRPVAA
jgi:methylated-DNA-[protein]-cysteine S-methyltransferase